MAGRHDCGPTAMLQVLRHRDLSVDRRRLCEAWRFRADCDRLDTPGHHVRALRRLGVPYAMKRRLGEADIAAAFDRGLPLVFLVPRGLVSWHWVVLCGSRGEAVRASYGDGAVRDVSRRALIASARAHRVGRALHVDGLGYVVADLPPFDTDVGLERMQLRLAGEAEEWLWPVETAGGLLRAAAAKLGWKKARGRDILSGAERVEIGERVI